MTAEQELAALKTKLRAAGYSHGYEIPFNDGTKVSGGCMSWADAQKAVSDLKWAAVRRGVKPLNDIQFNTIINNAPAVAATARAA